MPEIKDKTFCANVNVSYAAKAKNALVALFRSKKESTEVPSDEQVLIDIKSFSHSDHVELRKKALSVYLSSLHDILYGPEPINDPINVIGTVYAVYFSLHNSYVSYFFHEHHEVDWRLRETTNVRKHLG